MAWCVCACMHGCMQLAPKGPPGYAVLGGQGQGSPVGSAGTAAGGSSVGMSRLGPSRAGMAGIVIGVAEDESAAPGGLHKLGMGSMGSMGLSALGIKVRGRGGSDPGVEVDVQAQSQGTVHNRMGRHCHGGARCAVDASSPLACKATNGKVSAWSACMQGARLRVQACMRVCVWVSCRWARPLCGAPAAPSAWAPRLRWSRCMRGRGRGRRQEAPMPQTERTTRPQPLQPAAPLLRLGLPHH